MTATSPSDTMWAITQTTLGEPDVLTPTQVPRPTPPPGHILIRVHATSLNPTDWVHRRYPGFLGPINPADPPRILGWDVSGTIEQLGFRDNPKGLFAERWSHSAGCRRWFNAIRDTSTYRFHHVYLMDEPKPELS